MLKTLRNTLVGLSILLLAVFVSAATILIDGDMSDWTPAMQLDVAPGYTEETGDFAYPSLDIKDVYMTNDADYVYVRIDINEDGLLSDIPDVPGVFQFFFDTDMSAETGLTWDWWATGCDFILNPLDEGNIIQHYIGEGGSAEDYEDVGTGYSVAINGDDNGFEFAVPRVDLGLDAADASTRILVLNEEMTDWSNDAYPGGIEDDLGSWTVEYYFGHTITIDGDMSDWAPGHQMDVAPNMVEETGDFAYPSMDIKDVYMAHDDDYIYVRLDINEDGLFGDIPDVPGVISVFLDTDVSAATGLTWDWWATGCDYVLNPLDEGNIIQHYIGEGGSAEDYEDVGSGYEVAINGDDNAFELAIPRADVGEVGVFYEGLNLLILNEEMTDWSNDAFPGAIEDDLGYQTALFSFGAGGTRRADPVTIDEDQITLPSEFAIIGNYPNPFNPSTTIRFSLNTASAVSLDIYNMLGQKVATVYNGMGQTGANEVTWNGTNDLNQSVDSGVYIYRVSTPAGAVSGKMIMLK
ncbi:T9SS type A sorting domain-containing protein [bacterium]|nr:T9SS type A sorting domain-containing protein [bacterium]